MLLLLTRREGALRAHQGLARGSSISPLSLERGRTLGAGAGGGIPSFFLNQGDGGLEKFGDFGKVTQLDGGGPGPKPLKRLFLAAPGRTDLGCGEL